MDGNQASTAAFATQRCGDHSTSAATAAVHRHRGLEIVNQGSEETRCCFTALTPRRHPNWTNPIWGLLRINGYFIEWKKTPTSQLSPGSAGSSAAAITAADRASWPAVSQLSPHRRYYLTGNERWKMLTNKDLLLGDNGHGSEVLHLLPSSHDEGFAGILLIPKPQTLSPKP